MFMAIHAQETAIQYLSGTGKDNTAAWDAVF
jgi:hypothetical protein